MRIIDISPLVHPALSVWPGDEPYAMRKALDIHQGAHIDLGAMKTTFHVGAHTDAHRHYVAGGADAASMPLEAYYGPCEVVDVAVGRGQRFGWDHLRPKPAAPRVLFRTGTFPDPEHWNDDFAAPEPDLVDRLADQGCVLMGFDTPSTDLFASKGLPAHRRLAARGVVNLEGLVLSHVRPGPYTLVALPLRLKDADASPVRAVLVA